MSHQRDGRRDFDDELGTWRTSLSVLRPPLGGSGTWVEFVGTTHVSPVWGGAANLVQLDASGATGEVFCTDGGASWETNWVAVDTRS